MFCGNKPASSKSPMYGKATEMERYPEGRETAMLKSSWFCGQPDQVTRKAGAGRSAFIGAALPAGELDPANHLPAEGHATPSADVQRAGPQSAPFVCHTIACY